MLWPDIERAYAWAHRAAHIPNNHNEEGASVVRRRFDGLLAAMYRHRGKAEALADTAGHFRKVARSDWPGLFHCYAVPGLPRTRFRRDPDAYLAVLEQQACQLTLPT